MRKIEEFRITSNRNVYNRIHKTFHAGCDRCARHGGCNRRKEGAIQRSWKKFRKNQWKEI